MIFFNYLNHITKYLTNTNYNPRSKKSGIIENPGFALKPFTIFSMLGKV